MRDLAILADDLTGALDAAAPFASAARPVEASWTRPPEGDCVLDSETRHREEAAAVDRASALLPLLVDSRIALKKIDSLLRGNTFAELAAGAQSGLFETICVAPAFPAQGRTTVHGVQHIAGKPALSIVDALAGREISAAVLPAGDAPGAPGVFVCDASTDADLERLVHNGRGRRVLWCGSSGLARALAGKPPAPASASPTLAIIGSRHAASRAHAATLSRGLRAAAVPASDAAAIPALADALRTRGRAALLLDLPEMSPDCAERRYRETFDALVASVVKPAAIIVAGGDTLLRLMQSLGAVSLSVLGERSPGVPVSRIRGGGWDGCCVISKSGAFADAGLFAEFIHQEP
jgi:uncharacterized protein YgbK (DUF1537 family)